MSKYKIIFSDIDGTLLTSNHEVSERTKDRINDLKKRNIPFVLVSARMPKGISKVQKEINYKSPIVCYSGGLVVDKSGKYILSNGINIVLAHEIKKYINSNWSSVSTSCYCYDDWIVDDKENEWIKQESDITSVEPIEGEIIDACSNKVIHKILCMGKPDLIDELQSALLNKYSGLSIYKSKDTYLEIMDADAKKSGAMKILCDLFKNDICESIAIGDNYNDVDMIKAAGLGVAMGNAPLKVKNISDEVTDTNDNDGVAKVIEKHL